MCAAALPTLRTVASCAAQAIAIKSVKLQQGLWWSALAQLLRPEGLAGSYLMSMAVQ